MRRSLVPAGLLLAAAVLSAQAQEVIEGLVFDKETKAPLPAYISLPELDRGVSAGPDGRFRFVLESLPGPGRTVRLVVWLIGFKRLEVEARPGEPLSLGLDLEPLPAREVVVTADSGLAGDKSQAAVILDRMDVYRMPGTAADPLYASQVLPGVNSMPDSSSLLIRGGAPDETAYYLDGVEVLRPFLSQSLHESYFSIFDNQVIEDLTVSTAGFSPKHGDALSGVMDITAKDILFKGEGGLGLSVIGLNSYLGTPLPGEAAFIGSLNASRSELMTALNGGDGQSFGAWNGFGKVVSRIGPAHTVRLIGLYDHYGFAGEHAFNAGSSNGLAAFSLTSAVSEKLFSRVSLSRTLFRAEYDQPGAFEKTLDDRAWQGRVEASLDLGRHFVETGFDIQDRTQEVAWEAGESGNEEARSKRRSFYFQDHFRMFDKLYVAAGFRISSLTLGRPGWTADPRLSLVYFSAKHSVLRLSAGTYSQYADAFVLRKWGGLRPRTARHVSLSYDRTTDTTSVRITAYDKSYRNLVLQGPGGADAAPENRGHGYARGAEVFLKRRGRRLDVLGVYNYLSSRRMEGDVMSLAPSPYGITHSMTAIATYKTPRASFGLRYSHATGRPYTPLLDRVWDDAAQVYRPVWGEPNSLRYPSYRRADINGNWNLDLGKRMAVLYFGVTNLFNARNVLRYEYGDDYSVRNNTMSIFGRTLFIGLYFPFF